jgi:hypothetical protein
MTAFGVESIEPKPSSASDKKEVANDGNDDDDERERVLRDGGGAEGTAVRHELRVFNRWFGLGQIRNSYRTSQFASSHDT